MPRYVKNKNICLGTGLIALDVVLNGKPETPAKLYVGGSCGNVLTILSFLGWQSYPIARLAKNKATKEIESELKFWNVNTQLISKTENGSTPIIIHRILKDNNGNPKHRFEFKDPETGTWLPSYKSVLHKDVTTILDKQPASPKVFYFDRISRGNIELAVANKSQGALIFFEPSSLGESLKMFNECLAISDIIKYSNDRIPNYKSLFPDQQVPLEIETLGSEGLEFRYGKTKRSTTWHKLAPYKINSIADAAGAGDWCSAGIIHKLCLETVKDNSLGTIKEALKYGQALGAINCSFSGARGIMYNLSIGQLRGLVNQLNHGENLHIRPSNSSTRKNSHHIKLQVLYS